MDKQFDLERFVAAQEDLYADALAEIRNGRKTSHWMWFVFPQIQGLGLSSLSQKFAIQGRGEAIAYLQHQVLGPRLVEISRAILEVEGKSALEILGHPDCLKLRSCMTLFAQVSPENPVFQQVLDTYFGGWPDERTLELLEE